ncbi:MAG: monofunctional biosynthetic peptidoglycan transglycosylase [Burkholderiaceae bacterium]|nr:monofunctional biosynthetic peptidoglycan transglycosylase [Burkholderiaceae bacterium]
MGRSEFRRRRPPGQRARPRVARLLRAGAWTLLLAITAVLAVQLWYFGRVLWWSHVDPGTTRFMRQELSRLRETDPRRELRHRWVPYERISVHLKRAVIAAEDANFTDHDGVDWDAIERAYEHNRKRGRVVRGGSTITMQLAKNLFLSGERSYLRKAQEVVISYMIETVMSKRRILELYLNVAEWGAGVFGAEAGARHYYGVSAAQLEPWQAARMAAMLPRPRYHDANRDSAALARRAAIVGRWMGSVDPP